MPIDRPARGPLPALAAEGALRVALVYNPRSGTYSTEVLDKLRRALGRAGHSVRCHDVARFDGGDGDEPVPAAEPPEAGDDGDGDERPVDTVCVFGGDGTLRSLVARIRAKGRNPAFCVFPAGTINLIAREARYPARVSPFIRRLSARGAPRRHFMGRVSGEPFLCCASVGPDAEVVARVSEPLKRRIGRWAYVVAVARLAWRWPRHRLAVTIDGEAHLAEAVFVCKGRYYAGPWSLDERARLDDDQFRVLLMPGAGRLDVVRLALSTMVNAAFADPAWRRVSAREVAIAGPEGLPIQADGDVVGRTPATLSIDNEPLRFL